MTKRKVSVSMAVLAVAALVLTAVVPGAFAQVREFKFQIPFDFYAGGNLMPAGNYIVAYNPATRATQVFDNGGHIATVLPLSMQGRAIGNNRIVFNRYGGLAFLSEMQWAGTENGLKVRDSQLERDARLGTDPIRVAVQPK